ncbi:uncharacterized protein J7T54_004550 [Emericellopsis cladophorae]|uniref:FAD/NAD(P)-binding domain-containing protein n=1 Tax=Emericellopsis cladophorae TaxID=2686198 RepID=A0A9P9Y6U6_9HYPO|nr:uncharacterized protein J7T54_004550 [Emericellopsis cladophorae]KAI6784004.1 hypothetical protein J7T54_004550 [Emericellopsis cladophorae]
MEKFDCVVVGAGWYGLGAAKQYHCMFPDSSLVVFDAAPTLGGTWADHRIYPGLKSNNLLGTFEFPDFPMDTATFGVAPREHIPGGVLNAYLKAYAARFGIDTLIRANSKVTAAEHQETAEGGWVLTVSNDQQETTVFARRLIVASGLTSEAFLPHFDGQETFGGRIFHGRDFLQNKDTIQEGKSVTVYGGSKFAWDAVYAYASAGTKVNWVIRYVRFLSWFSPCIWGDVDGFGHIRRFLHGTAFGRALVDGFWRVLGGDVLALNKYDAHPKTAKLKPWTEAMFTATSFSIVNWETDIWELIKSDLVDVHIGEIDHLSPGKVHLADGTEFESDAFLAHTGWKHVPPMKFLPEGIERELGLPHAPVQDAPGEDLANQTALMERADKEILARFPRLKNQPVWNKHYIPMTEQKGIRSSDKVTPYTPLTPFMLYHFIVPPAERFLRTRDVAFAGMVSNFSNVITSHLQGLWISAYFSGRLANDPAAAVGDQDALAALRYETVLHNRDYRAINENWKRKYGSDKSVAI